MVQFQNWPSAIVDVHGEQDNDHSEETGAAKNNNRHSEESAGKSTSEESGAYNEENRKQL